MSHEQERMTPVSKGREFFIVGNSVSGWTGFRYLGECSGIAKAFDIATGYFEIGAQLALDRESQGLDKIWILMGAETKHRALREGKRAVGWSRYATGSAEPAPHGTGVGQDALRKPAESLTAANRLGRKRWPA